MALYEDVTCAAEYLRRRTLHRPETCIIPGSGLDALIEAVMDSAQPN